LPWVRVTFSAPDLAKDTLKSKGLLAESCALEATRTQGKAASDLRARLIQAQSA